jgi:small ligand-binding sensory domain FIST
MKWVSAISQKWPMEETVTDCARSLAAPLSDLGPPDLAFLFVSTHFSSRFEQVGDLIRNAVAPKALIGCSGGGVIGAGLEIEQQPALSLTCAWLPDVQIQPFYVSNTSLPDLEAPPKIWHNLIGVSPEKRPQFVVLADPFSIRVDHFISALDYAFPYSVKVGGLASGAQQPGGNALYLNKEVHREGLVGVALGGNLALDTIVAQGCRPIGKPMTVTDCRDQLLLEVDGRPPLFALQELYETLPPRDQALVQTSLFLGIVMDPSRESYQQGDFLIRNIIDAEMEEGVLVVGSELRPGQIVQFHLRDAQTSAQDLRQMLEQHKASKDTADAAGALLFSCLGRGAYLYGRANHDTELFLKKLGNIPLGGFFCNGEIGPVSGTTYLHGYTSCFGIFHPRPADAPGPR